MKGVPSFLRKGSTLFTLILQFISTLSKVLQFSTICFIYIYSNIDPFLNFNTFFSLSNFSHFPLTASKKHLKYTLKVYFEKFQFQIYLLLYRAGSPSIRQTLHEEWHSFLKYESINLSKQLSNSYSKQFIDYYFDHKHNQMMGWATIKK